jgi:hypothetical protein
MIESLSILGFVLFMVAGAAVLAMLYVAAYWSEIRDDR